jgi:regulatory associated protein of mTOR
MERLRARRRTAAGSGRGRHHHPHHAYPGAPSPSDSVFSMDSTGTVITGLGTGVGIRDALPLRSRFYEWCIEYFKEPQMRVSFFLDRSGEMDADCDMDSNLSKMMPVARSTTTRCGGSSGTSVSWARSSRRRPGRAENAGTSMSRQCRCPGARSRLCSTHTIRTCSWRMSQTRSGMNGHSRSLDVVADHRFSVWDWSKRKMLVTFGNGSTPGYGVTSLHVINQWQGGMILAGSADGVARLYRNYDSEAGAGPPQLVSAFRVLGESVPVKRGAGLVLDWRQPGGTLLAGGDARVIKLWDAHTESALMDLDTNAEAPCCALSSEAGGAGATFLAAFADGGVKLMDRRMEEDDAVVRSYRAHASWVQNARWHPIYGGQFFTAR